MPTTKKSMGVLEALRWALKNVRMPSGVDPEIWARKYNQANQALAEANKRKKRKS